MASFLLACMKRMEVMALLKLLNRAACETHLVYMIGQERLPGKL